MEIAPGWLDGSDVPSSLTGRDYAQVIGQRFPCGCIDIKAVLASRTSAFSCASVGASRRDNQALVRYTVRRTQAFGSTLTLAVNGEGAVSAYGTVMTATLGTVGAVSHDYTGSSPQ